MIFNDFPSGAPGERAGTYDRGFGKCKAGERNNHLQVFFYVIWPTALLQGGCWDGKLVLDSIAFWQFFKGRASFA